MRPEPDVSTLGKKVLRAGYVVLVVVGAGFYAFWIARACGLGEPSVHVKIVALGVAFWLANIFWLWLHWR